MLSRLPNILTISRIAITPFILVALAMENEGWNEVAAILFIIAATTDFFDGFLARLMGSRSEFGRALDHIADKLMVSALLIFLAYLGKASVIAVILIVSREVLVSGLREFMYEVGIGMPVSKLGKLKTVVQMGALLFLILASAGTAVGYFAELLLWSAVGLTLYTGYDYMRIVMKSI